MNTNARQFPHEEYRPHRVTKKARGMHGCMLALLALVLGICLVPVILAIKVDKNNPPPSLLKSSETVIRSVYPTLQGTSKAKDLYPILEPGVSVYYLMGPDADHPVHKRGDYRVNLFQSRWHCDVYPLTAR